jgi:CHAT domain
MNLPVIFLAFANSSEDPLGLLDEERKSICEVLIPLESEQYFQLYREPTANTDDVVQYLTEFKDRVVLFHYGGHANSKQLLLRGEEAHADGIAELLAQQDNIKVVFLNGCSTKGQVDLLLELGIPAVIATSIPVNDKKAMEFATTFYKALANRFNLQEAFETAASAAKTKTGKEVKIYRGVAKREADQAEVFPWGLYVSENKQEVLKWKLPSTSHKSIVITDTTAAPNPESVQTNKHLTQTLFEAFAPYNEFLEFALFKHQKGETIEIRKVRQAIMDCLPAPIGDQIRRLFALDEVGRERLEQIISTYNSLTELMVFTLLSQLWDTKFLNKEAAISEEAKTVINQYFQQEVEELSFYDYMKLLRSIRGVFEDNNIEFFVDEFSTLRKLIYEDETFSGAHEYLQKIKQHLYKEKDKISGEEMRNYCINGERQLSNIFNKLGFLVKYKLVTVKGIGLIKARHKNPSYRVKKVFLDNITAGLLDEEAMYDTFTDNNAVILLKAKTNFADYLNLSPFIIDENALIGENKSKLYFFSHYDKVSGNYHYKFAFNTGDKLIINDQKYPEIKSDFLNFSQLLLG